MPRFARPPRGGKRPSKPRQGAFSHPRRGVLRPPSQKRHYVSVFARLTPQGAAAPRQSRFPPLVCLSKGKEVGGRVSLPKLAVER